MHPQVRQSYHGNYFHLMRVTAEFVRALSSAECARLTALHVSRWDPSACSGFTPACLDQFDVTDLGFECMLNLPVSTTYELSLKTSLEILNSRSENIYLTPVDLNMLLDQYGEAIHEFPRAFLEYISTSPRMSVALVRMLSRMGLNNLLNQYVRTPFIEKIPALAFRYLRCASLGALPVEAFAALSDEQLEAIPEDSWDCLTAEQLKVVRPAQMKLMTVTTIINLGPDLHKLLIVDQVQAMGKDQSELPAEAGIVDRRSFVENHPCFAFRKRMGNVTEMEVRRALVKRCSFYWSPDSWKATAIAPASKSPKSSSSRSSGNPRYSYRLIVGCIASISLIIAINM